MATPKRPKRPRDPNSLAFRLVQESIGEAERPKVDTVPEPPQLGTGITLNEPKPEPKKNPHAVALGKLGGAKGGPARAKKLTKAERSEIGKKAAKARWKKNPT